MAKINQIIPLEAMIWLLGLILLALLNPNNNQALFSLCIFHHIGWENCPGCGLGTSIALIFRGDFYNSIQTHALGIPTLIILVHRIIVLSINHYQHGKSYRYTS
jgi:hypothetical protein